MAKKIESKFGFSQRNLIRRPSSEARDVDAAGEETTESLSLASSLAAYQMGKSQSGVKQVEAFINGTTTTSRYTGSQGPAIARYLGDQVTAYETKAGCSTSLASLHFAFSLLSLGHENVMLSCSETLSKVINPDIKETWFGLADGASALWMEKNESQADFHIKSLFYGTDGQHVDMYTTQGRLPPSKQVWERGGYFLEGDGAKLRDLSFQHYMMMFEKLFPQGKGLEKIKWFIPHQVNKALVNDIYKEKKLTCELVWSADRIGNIGGSSILFSLVEALEKNIFKSGDEILMMSVGGGLSFAAQHWVKT